MSTSASIGEQLTTQGAGSPLTSRNVLPVRRPGRWIATAIIALAALGVINALVTNPNIQWGVVAHYFTSPNVLIGLVRTVQLTVIAMAIGVVLGVAIAVMKLSQNPLVSGAAASYVWFFRGTPLLVQIVFWYNLAALFPTVSIGIPFGPTFASANSNELITPFLAAILALGLNEAAYLSEIVRSGLLAVDPGQTEAAQALGMSQGKVLRRIILPQAMRVIVPPVGNETISMLKLTSLVSVISLPELLYSVQVVYQATYQVIPLLLVASIWYLIVTTILSIGQRYLERYYGRGFGVATANTPRRKAAQAKASGA
ncbi:amino acid ABC transporter permease [Mycolicibacterium sp. P9-64]|uniref:amino acid ABC transporter permease n=1 Tax=Mycolicibacterium sp. P9-64 TaxID=2024612 RepID=UPI0011EF97B2|nr:amino acid ABC transporter permease [Mycolicibacterium sp. P9-64]KAA0078849.1 amino acid ABC transporter permease [Mycolicibacterium sp. P9-64]